MEKRWPRVKCVQSSILPQAPYFFSDHGTFFQHSRNKQNAGGNFNVKNRTGARWSQRTKGKNYAVLGNVQILPNTYSTNESRTYQLAAEFKKKPDCIHPLITCGLYGNFFNTQNIIDLSSDHLPIIQYVYTQLLERASKHLEEVRLFRMNSIMSFLKIQEVVNTSKYSKHYLKGIGRINLPKNYLQNDIFRRARMVPIAYE